MSVTHTFLFSILPNKVQVWKEFHASCKSPVLSWLVTLVWFTHRGSASNSFTKFTVISHYAFLSLSPLPQRISSVHRIAVLSTIYSFIQLHKISTNDRHELAGSSLCIQQHLHLGHSVAQNFTKTEQWLHSCRRFILLGPHISYKLKIVCSYEIADVCVYIYIYTGGPPYLWIQYPQF